MIHHSAEASSSQAQRPDKRRPNERRLPAPQEAVAQSSSAASASCRSLIESLSGGEVLGRQDIEALPEVFDLQLEVLSLVPQLGGDGLELLEPI